MIDENMKFNFQEDVNGVDFTTSRKKLSALSEDN